MPKLKTRKSISKRLKQTANGKFIRKQGGKSHILTKKRPSRKSKLGKDVSVKKTEYSKIKSGLPYGIN